MGRGAIDRRGGGGVLRRRPCGTAAGACGANGAPDVPRRGYGRRGVSPRQVLVGCGTGNQPEHQRAARRSGRDIAR